MSCEQKSGGRVGAAQGQGGQQGARPPGGVIARLLVGSLPAFCSPSQRPEPIPPGGEDTAPVASSLAWGNGTWASAPAVSSLQGALPRPGLCRSPEQPGVIATLLLVRGPPWARCMDGGLGG